jgi:hypothetical protein
LCFHFFVVFLSDAFSANFFGDVLLTIRLMIDPLLFVVIDSSPLCSTTVERLARESDLGDFTCDSGLTLLPPILLINDFALLSAFKVSFSGMGSSWYTSLLADRFGSLRLPCLVSGEVVDDLVVFTDLALFTAEDDDAAGGLGAATVLVDFCLSTLGLTDVTTDAGLIAGLLFVDETVLGGGTGGGVGLVSFRA